MVEEDQRAERDENGQPHALQQDRHKLGGVVKEFFHQPKCERFFSALLLPSSSRIRQRAVLLQPASEALIFAFNPDRPAHPDRHGADGGLR